MMEILEAFDLVGTFRGAAGLVGCDHKTVARVVALREAAGGGAVGAERRAQPAIDPFAAKIAEWVDRSKGAIRADAVHERLLLMGYEGCERTTRRAVAAVKQEWRREHGRRTRPWIPEPGLWLQFDYGDGPRIAGRATFLLCAWLAWSRFRVIVPLVDKTLPNVVLGLDRVLRVIGGAPTYVLTDNERTVTIDHVCGIAIRNPRIVAAARHYGFTVQTCVPADPESKGGSESTVRIAKADLVPTEHNLREQYTSFEELEQACRAFTAKVNARAHRVTRQSPALMLEIERARLHRLPATPHMLCFGQTRKVARDSTVSVGGAIYSVPCQLVEQRVWARVEGEQLVIVVVGEQGPREVARHALTTPGRPSIRDEHYPPRPPGALERQPKASSADEDAFLAIGPDAAEWLTRAAAAGTARVRAKLAEAVELAKLHGSAPVNAALASAAQAGRFEDGALASILAHQQHQRQTVQSNVVALPVRASEHASLQRSTAAWKGFGT